MTSLLDRGRLAFLVVLVGIALLVLASSEPAAAPPAPANGYLFCFWNVENFFDDRKDGWMHEPDKSYDSWFSGDPKALRQKLDNLTEVLMKMAPGRGPDILAMAECESEHVVELLRDHLNAEIKDKGLHYKNILYKDPKGGRAIATAILTRLDVDREKTKLHGFRQRILEGHIKANGHDLIVLAAHWTSRVSDKEGVGRDKYAELCHKAFETAYRQNPKVDFLVCGDFNDPPDEESVTKHLRAIGDVDKVKRGGADGPFLLDLMSREELIGKKPLKGSHYYRGTWYMFDQIAVSPGLLDKAGWSCDPTTMHIASENMSLGRNKVPHRFGDERDETPLRDRGYSDHFPVTVRLTVAK